MKYFNCTECGKQTEWEEGTILPQWVLCDDCYKQAKPSEDKAWREIRTPSGKIALAQVSSSDALLYNAAPDLLEACKAAHESLAQLAKIGRIPENMAGLRLTEAAIAKAEGR